MQTLYLEPPQNTTLLLPPTSTSFYADGNSSGRRVICHGCRGNGELENTDRTDRYAGNDFDFPEGESLACRRQMHHISVIYIMAFESQLI
jgi:hypothetical protein